MNQALILNMPFSLGRKQSLRWKLIFRIFWVFTSFSVISLLVFYILQVNFLTKDNYILKNQEKKLIEIKKEGEILKVDFAKANSLGKIEAYFQNQNFEKANGVKYIKILETSVVSK